MSAQKILTNLILLFYYWIESFVLTVIPKRLRFKSVHGQVVVITGAGSGIGRELALRFSSRGARVVVWDVDMRGALETTEMVKARGGEAHAYLCDVSQEKNVNEVAVKTKSEVGKVDILVNNAGIVRGKPFLDLTSEDVRKVFEVNVMAHFWTCKAFLPDMIAEDKGHLVFITSLAGHMGCPKLSEYCASKFAAVGLEESLRLELEIDGHMGVHSTVVCPFFINTGMFDGFRPGLLPPQSPESVADDIISAVLVNQRMIVIPKTFYFFLFLKAILPLKAWPNFAKIVCLDGAMDNFKGRQKKTS